MTIKTEAIVLSAIKYGDSDLIVKCYTSEGLKTYLLKRILGAKKGKKLKPSYFQPLMQLELVARHNNKGQLNYIKEAHISKANHSVHTDIVKQILAIFISEILVQSLYEEESNDSLFKFLEMAIAWLNNHAEVANFHLVFMLRLTQHLGFYPDQMNQNLTFFDLSEGVFTTFKPSGAHIAGEKLAIFSRLLGTNFDDLKALRLTSEDRYEALEILIQYFELHLPLFRKPKSLTILKTVFE